MIIGEPGPPWRPPTTGPAQARQQLLALLARHEELVAVPVDPAAPDPRHRGAGRTAEDPYEPPPR